MRLPKLAQQAAAKLFSIVDVVKESDPENREVQCEGECDETESGRELIRQAWHLGPGGFKHRAVGQSKALLLRLFGTGVIIGIQLDDGAPTDLAEGETALYSKDGARVICRGTKVEIGTGTGGKLIRLDYLQTQWNAGPRANHLLHTHPGVMPGPGSSAVTTTDLGEIPDSVACDDGSTVK